MEGFEVFGLILLCVVVGVIWLEVVVFGLVSQEFGVLLTIIGVFVTAAIGIRLLRASGASTLHRMRMSVAQGKLPVLELADGAAILLGALLLLIPGYATDLLGFILFVPGVRTVIMVGVLTLLQSLAPRMSGRSFSFRAHGAQMDSMQMDDDVDDSDEDSPFVKNSFEESGNYDKEDASNVTIEGDYKRDD